MSETHTHSDADRARPSLDSIDRDRNLDRVNLRPRPAFSHHTPTIEDVARQAGVSRQTVSNVLNAPERVRPDTAAAVRQTIDQLGYRANRHARNLRTQTSRVIGYCLPPLSTSGGWVMDTFLHSFVESAEAVGYHTLLFRADGLDAEIELYKNLAAQSAVDGIVFACTVTNDPRVTALHDLRLPFVSFGRTWGTLDHAWVDVDGAAGTQAVVRHLLGQGHRKFAWVGHEPNSPISLERERGARETIHSSGVEDCTLVVVPEADLTSESEPVLMPSPGGAPSATIVEALDRLLDADRQLRPTAFITCSDQYAIAVLSALESRGLRIGLDAAVVGFDDSALAPFVGGGLSSVRQPLSQVASELVRLLHRQFTNPTEPPEGVLIPPELVIRRTG